MPSPTFDGKKLFSSLTSAADADTVTYIDEGVLWVPSYGGIVQKIHVEGATNDLYLSHGFPDRAWVFQGILSATTLADLNGLLKAIETYIDQSVNDPTIYKALVDSFGNSFIKAQTRSLHKLNFHADGTAGAYVAHVQVDGIIQGQTQDGGH